MENGASSRAASRGHQAEGQTDPKETTATAEAAKKEKRRQRDKRLRKLQALRRKARMAAASGMPVEGGFRQQLQAIEAINGSAATPGPLPSHVSPVAKGDATSNDRLYALPPIAAGAQGSAIGAPASRRASQGASTLGASSIAASRVLDSESKLDAARAARDAEQQAAAAAAPRPDWPLWAREGCQICGTGEVGCPACWSPGGRIKTTFGRHAGVAAFDRSGARAAGHAAAGSFVAVDEDQEAAQARREQRDAARARLAAGVARAVQRRLAEGGGGVLGDSESKASGNEGGASAGVGESGTGGSRVPPGPEYVKAAMEQAKAAGLGLVGLARVLGVPVPEDLQDDDKDEDESKGKDRTGGTGGRRRSSKGSKVAATGPGGGESEKGMENGANVPSRAGVTSARPKSRLGGAEAPSTQEAAAQLPDAASHALEELIGNAFGSSPERLPEPGPGHGRRRASRRRSTHGASGAGGASRGGAAAVHGGGKRSSMGAAPRTDTETPNAGKPNTGSQHQHQHRGTDSDPSAEPRLAKVPKGPLVLRSSSLSLAPSLRVAKDVPSSTVGGLAGPAGAPSLPSSSSSSNRPGSSSSSSGSGPVPGVDQTPFVSHTSKLAASSAVGLLDRDSLLRWREFNPPVECICHDPMLGRTRRLVLPDSTHVEFLAWAMLLAMGAEWNTRCSLVVPSQLGGFLLDARPRALARPTAAAGCIGDLCKKSSGRRRLHVLMFPTPQGRACNGHYKAFLQRNIAPSAGSFWRVEVRRDVGAAPAAFPRGDEAQAAMDRALLPREAWAGSAAGVDPRTPGRLTHSVGPLVLRLQEPEHVLHGGAHRKGRPTPGMERGSAGREGSMVLQLQAGPGEDGRSTVRAPRQLQLEWTAGGRGIGAEVEEAKGAAGASASRTLATPGLDMGSGSLSGFEAESIDQPGFDVTARSADPRVGYMLQDGRMAHMPGLRMLVPPLQGPGREALAGPEVMAGTGSRPISRQLSLSRRAETRALQAGWVRPPATQAAALAHALSGRLEAGLGPAGTVPADQLHPMEGGTVVLVRGHGQVVPRVAGRAAAPYLGADDGTGMLRALSRAQLQAVAASGAVGANWQGRQVSGAAFLDLVQEAPVLRPGDATVGHESQVLRRTRGVGGGANA